jgi:hypothetical protein
VPRMELVRRLAHRARRMACCFALASPTLSGFFRVCEFFFDCAQHVPPPSLLRT